jgi:1,2-phenylacetyl-CoA epoxidase catalytic subunit
MTDDERRKTHANYFRPPSSVFHLPSVDAITDIKPLAPELQRELRNFLVALADTKRALGLRYAEWCDRAPTLEAGVAASAMAQDQLGQARVLYALIQEQYSMLTFDFDDETRGHSQNLAFLDRPFSDWLTFVLANFLIGAGVTLTEEALADSRLVPLRQRMPKMLEEERYHRVHAEGWLKYFEQRQDVRLRDVAAQILPEVLCWFGDAQHSALSEAEILTLAPGELRERYMERVGPLLQQGAARDLVLFHEHAQRWSYTGALPWGQFDAVTRRVSTDWKRINE